MSYIACKCPRCGSAHKIKAEYEWTGNGTLRKYCHQCKITLRDLNGAFPERRFLNPFLNRWMLADELRRNRDLHR